MNINLLMHVRILAFLLKKEKLYDVIMSSNAKVSKKYNMVVVKINI